MNRKRLFPSVFKIPTDKLRTGYYSDRYFLRTRDVLLGEHHRSEVGYQFFPREDAVICGLDEAIAILKTCAGIYRNPRQAEKLYEELRQVQWKLQDAASRQRAQETSRWERKRAGIREELNGLWEGGWKKIKVFALYDGAAVKNMQPVLVIVGNPVHFSHLETPLLGVIARPTSTATQVARVVRAARTKQVFFFSARFDHYWVQATDGYAALKAGAFGVSTNANADYWGAESFGTVPHFLIGCFEGDTAKAFSAFDRRMPQEVQRIALVDWDNDCIETTRQIVEALLEQKYSKEKINCDFFLSHAREVMGKGKNRLWGVRFDTSQALRDKSVTSTEECFGVCPELVRKARREFDRWGCRNLKIIVSGGFDAARIERFESLKLPVDAYGVGSSLLRHKIDITADIVEYEGSPCAKVGRKRGDWSKLDRVR